MQQMNQPGLFRSPEVGGTGFGVLCSEHHVGPCIDVRHLLERFRWVPLETAGDGVLTGAPHCEFLAGVGPFLPFAFFALLFGAEGGFLALPADQLTG
jgi:hypothetical protein